MRRRFTRALPLLLVGALLFAACGDDDDDTSAEAGNQSTAEQTTSTEASSTPSESSTPDSAAPGSGTATKPEFEVPAGDPPKTLEIKDLVVGTGAEAKTGDDITVQYAGKAYSTRQQFDASWDRGEPFAFTLGAKQVIDGWDEGLVGMKVGGRRQIIIPPEKAYKEAGRPPRIGPNDTLVFVVDLVSIP